MYSIIFAVVVVVERTNSNEKLIIEKNQKNMYVVLEILRMIRTMKHF